MTNTSTGIIDITVGALKKAQYFGLYSIMNKGIYNSAQNGNAWSMKHFLSRPAVSLRLVRFYVTFSRQYIYLDLLGITTIGHDEKKAKKSSVQEFIRLVNMFLLAMW